MRLLIITPEYPPDCGGGIATYYRDCVPALAAAGCKVTILKGSAYIHGKSDEVINGVIIKYLETKRFEKWIEKLVTLEMFSQLRRHLAAAFALHEQAEEGERFDVVEVVDWGMQFLPWTISTRAPFLVQLHGSDGQIALKDPVVGCESEGLMSLLLERAGMPYTAGISGISTMNVRFWEDLLDKKIDYFLPPFQRDKSSASLCGQRRGWVSFGRVQRWKGPQVACEAWKIIGNQAPELQWYGKSMLNGGSGRSLSERLKGSFPEVWGKKIVHLDPVSPSKVSDLMATAKVVLVPSVWDTFNYVVAEAMAHGCVGVVSDGAGAADLIQHGKNGFLFPAGNAKALASLVEEVEALSAKQIEAIGQAASMTIAQSMDPATVTRKKIELYKTLKMPEERCDWLKQMLLSFQNNPERSKLMFLNKLPLREVAEYVLGRASSKIKNHFF